ncbi:MAG TPA: DUF4124 domain-containing protein [Nevskia sp.]|nr:DUF4124 domain-containing protein [Nevskia sp.]
MRILIAVTLACLSSAAVAGDVYRWTDDKGVVHYSDKPQAPSDKPAELPHLQTYSHSASPPPSAPLADTAPAPKAEGGGGGGGSFSIASPAQDETIRDAEGKFTVTVSGSLQPGEGVIYYLDGTAENKEPTPSTAFLYARVDRGEHSVSAALIGADGRELERTAAVTIHVKPPTARH